MGRVLLGMTGQHGWRLTDPPHHCGGDVLHHDIAASYTFASNMSITADVTNLTNEGTPFIDTGNHSFASDPSTYRIFGRGCYLRLNQKL